MNKVAPKRLGDLITLKRGYDLPEKNRTKGPYPVISSAGISGSHNEYKVDGQGVVIGRCGTLGKTHFVGGKYWPHNTALYVQNFKGNDPKYIYYLLSCLGRIRTSDKSAVPAVNRNELHEMAIPAIEDRKLQVATRQVLEAIDGKIELNNKINTELESMAKLIYDYWFVQFDFPDANGKPYKSSGGKMVYNEALKREIPEGWEVEPLAHIEQNIITGKTPPTKMAEYFNGNVPFICIGDVRGNMHITNAEITLSRAGADSQANKYIPKGAICVTCIASPGLVGFASEESQTNQQLNTVVCSHFENRYYLYFYLKNYFRFAKAKSGNTFANMNKSDFSSIEVVKPRKVVLESFSELLKPSIENVLINSKENNKLSELRDWLLPMLMNGQVTVKDA